MSEQAEKLEVTGLENIIKTLDETEAQVVQKAEYYRHNFEQLFGVQPQQQVTAKDVVKIMLKFYGEPK